MKIDIEYLNATFNQSYTEFAESRDKAYDIWEMYHNRQYTCAQTELLTELGQPKQTFNIIKLFARQLLGYYSTIDNTTIAEPVQQNDVNTASIITDVFEHIDNNMYNKAILAQAKLDGILSGLFSIYTYVKPKTIRNEIVKDKWGRIVYDIYKEHVPSSEILLDPSSKAIDGSDARYTHRFRWIKYDSLVELFGKAKAEKIADNYNTGVTYTTPEPYNYKHSFTGGFKELDNYLIVHSIVKDTKGRTFSIYWTGDTIIEKTDITHSNINNPYVVIKLSDSFKPEYYGVFNDVYNSQHAINQALLQIQYLVNTNRVLVEEDAVRDIEEFKSAYKKVNAIVQVESLEGIRIDKLSAEIQQQYITIDKNLDHIQRVLGINDSFLGMAFASDSGRKVKLQQNATVVGLNYIDIKLEVFNVQIARNCLQYIKDYYHANRLLRLTDEFNQTVYREINVPLINPMTGEPIYDVAIDPRTGKEQLDDLGQPILVPLNTPDSDHWFDELDIRVVSVPYNDEDQQNQQIIDTILNGTPGQMLMQVNPKGYAQLVAFNLRMTKTRYSQKLAQVFDETANMLTPQPQMQQGLAQNSARAGGTPNVQTYTDNTTIGGESGQF